MIGKVRLEHALEAWEKAKAGEGVVVSDDHLELLAEHFRDADGVEAQVYFLHSFAATNRDRCGLMDPYVLKLSDKGRAILAQASMESVPAPVL
jgi:hypothetical protein